MSDENTRARLYDEAARIWDATYGYWRCVGHNDSLAIVGGPASAPKRTRREGGHLMGAVEITCQERTSKDPRRKVKAAIAQHDERVVGWFRLD